MTFLYEQLDDKSFQRLCQALLSKVHPGTIAYPVGQKDAGRDATSPAHDVIFQVKHTRNPQSIKDPIRWIKSTVEDEVAKVEKLYKAGARQYYLITNIRGTAAGDVGTMDRLQGRLKNALAAMPGLTVTPWWRDTIDAHLAGDLALQWAFPQILTGTQALAMLLEQLAQGDRQRQANAIQAYISTEYDATKLLRFKQVGLETTPLTALFVDVPVTPANGAFVASSQQWRDMLEGATGDDDLLNLRLEFGEDHVAYAADVLLSRHPVNRVIVSGGPGQGKSTLMQYVCQLHRSRLLGETDLRFPAHHSSSPLRLPFQVDLGRFGSWLRDSETGSLEEYISTLVARGAGGAAFSVEDFNAVIKDRPALVVLDALDEVPNRDLRAKVIDAIEQFGSRLARLSTGTLILVTTRPSFYTKEGALEPDKYLTLSLLRLPEQTCDAYLSKWLSARAIDRDGEASLRRLWDARKKDPHIASLRSNVMQLSILLYLMHVRGSSLPDQRTQLYDEYTRILLDRESDKDVRVASHREQLLEVHGYVAFHLQAVAEGEGFSGAVSEQELLQLIRKYQDGAGYASDVSELFAGVQRMVALVANQRGAFEFEVQPLREYFAARFLYDTAPYVPAGRRRAGQKDDRLIALLRRPYWSNVLRFFAGCFTAGELAGLLETLLAAAEDEQVPLPSMSRSVVRELLLDKLFTGKSSTEGRALRFAYSDGGLLGLQHILRAHADLSSSAQKQFLLEKYSEFITQVAPFAAQSVRAASGDLASTEQLFDLWWPLRPEGGAKLMRWLTLGAILRVAPLCSEEQASEVVATVESGEDGRIALAKAALPFRQAATDVADSLRLLLDNPLDVIGAATPASEAAYIYTRVHPTRMQLVLPRSIPVLGTKFHWEDGLLAQLQRSLAKVAESRFSQYAELLNRVKEITGETWGGLGAAMVLHHHSSRRQSESEDIFGLQGHFDVSISGGTAAARWNELITAAQQEPFDPRKTARVVLQGVHLAGESQMVKIAPDLEVLLRGAPEKWSFEISRISNLAFGNRGNSGSAGLPGGGVAQMEVGRAPNIWLLAFPRFARDEQRLLVTSLADAYGREPFLILGSGRGTQALLSELWSRVGKRILPMETLLYGIGRGSLPISLVDSLHWDDKSLAADYRMIVRNPAEYPPVIVNALERQLLASADCDIIEQAKSENWFVED